MGCVSKAPKVFGSKASGRGIRADSRRDTDTRNLDQRFDTGTPIGVLVVVFHLKRPPANGA